MKDEGVREAQAFGWTLLFVIIVAALIGSS